MKAIVPLKYLSIEVEGDTQAELFEAMASVQEVFGEETCGLCGSDNIIPVVRKNKDDEKFFEYQCRGFIKEGDRSAPCKGHLCFGQNKKGGGLFPNRALDEKGKPDRETGKFGKHRGWTRYRGEPKVEGSTTK